MSSALCAECGESLVKGEDEWDRNEQGEDIHARCVPCDLDPDGVHWIGCGHDVETLG